MNLFYLKLKSFRALIFLAVFNFKFASFFTEFYGIIINWFHHIIFTIFHCLRINNFLSLFCLFLLSVSLNFISRFKFSITTFLTLHLQTRGLPQNFSNYRFRLLCLYIYVHMLYVYVLQVSHIAGPVIPARALRALRSVWSGSRLISPSTTEYNAVAHRAATPLHRERSDWSDWPRCVYYTNTHVYDARHTPK